MDKAIALRQMQDLLKRSKAPAELGKIIDMNAWVKAIVIGEPYEEPDPEFISRSIALRIVTAETIEDIFKEQRILKIQEMIPDVPGQSSGPIEVTDLYVAKSDFETGNPSYLIITATNLEHGYEWKGTTGATNVQATFIALLAHGMWPLRVQIKRGTTKDKGGRYLLHVLPPD